MGQRDKGDRGNRTDRKRGPVIFDCGASGLSADVMVFCL